MRKFCLVFIGLFLCIDGVNAAVRSQNNNTTTVRNATTTVKPRTIQNNTQKRSTSARSATQQTRLTSARSATTSKSISARSATNTTPVRTSRAATTQSRATLSRANSNTNVATNTFNTNYTNCRDAYFTCMDQFCAAQNETYRRCSCSSRLIDIQNKEKALSQTSDSLADFESLNLEMIPKSADEVKAMLSATSGESAIKKDSSQSASVLKNISDVLNKTKNKSLSTQGQLDIAGDIKNIWSTTDLIVGSDIANLSGESLYNAVHNQCAEIVAPECTSTDLKMVSSSYGMYIENDCSLLEANLNKQTISANADIRTTRHKMQDARLENYDAHNSISINECIANIRQDILADTACGENYVHCLDVSGKYLNITTGQPIYSSDFYQLENQISLDGDILNNSKNSVFVNMLNQKRTFASKNLDLCRDNSDEVWNEFMRQALIEIYQGQQNRVKEVKEECLKVVNDCYTDQSQALQSLLSKQTEANIITSSLETAEELCADKLTTCSNLYGGGPDGLALLWETMTNITNATIEQSCVASLETYAQKICSVPSSDTRHTYPYGCRKYAPGETRYARKSLCNSVSVNPFSRSDILITKTNPVYNKSYVGYCEAAGFSKQYTSCKFNFYLDKKSATCEKCTKYQFCPGGTEQPQDLDSNSNSKQIYEECGEYYVGSLYYQLVNYALQNCTRSDNQENILPESVLADIDVITNKIRVSLTQALASECALHDGTWVNSTWIDTDMDGYNDSNNDTLNQQFYISTGANELWGYCKN